jgi:hypothetical protein
MADLNRCDDKESGDAVAPCHGSASGLAYRGSASIFSSAIPRCRQPRAGGVRRGWPTAAKGVADLISKQWKLLNSSTAGNVRDKLG